MEELVIITRELNHYRRRFLHEIGLIYDLSVYLIYDRPVYLDIDKISYKKLDLFSVIKLILSGCLSNKVFVFNGYDSIYSILMIFLIPSSSQKVLQLDGVIKDGNYILNCLKRLILQRFDRIFSPSEISDVSLTNLSIRLDMIYRVRFGSYYNYEINNLIRKKNSEPNLICVARLTESKGIIELIIIFESLDVTNLTILGEGPLENTVKEIVNDFNSRFENKKITLLKNLKFEELLIKLRNYTHLILLTKAEVWGLVIPEAVSQGLDFVSTTNCPSAMEINREHEIGLIINNAPSLLSQNIEKINRYIFNGPTNLDLIIKIAKNYSIEKMIETFNEGVLSLEK